MATQIEPSSGEIGITARFVSGEMMRVEAYLDNLANLDFIFPEIDEAGRRPRMGAPSMLPPPFPTTRPERSKASTARAEKAHRIYVGAACWER